MRGGVGGAWLPESLRTFPKASPRGAFGEIMAAAAGSNPACGRCGSARAPYTCPRCRLRLCSVLCYREHGSCSGDFQAREVQLRLQGQRAGEASRRRLEEALVRLSELREPGDEGCPLGLGADLEPEERLWQSLGPEERKAFQRLLDSGEILALVPPWKPWWEEAGDQGVAPLIQELDPLNAPKGPPEEPGQAKGPQLPAHLESAGLHLGRLSNSVPSNIPAVSSLTTSPVSPLVPFQLPNVLYAYAYALSLYNGDVGAELLPEFCQTVLDISGSLGAKRGYGSVAEALHSAQQAVAAGRYPECPLGHGGAMGAVARLLAGGSQAISHQRFALVALGHLSGLLGEGRRRAPAQDRARLFGAKKKCEFLLSWANENQEELPSMALEARREYEAQVGAAEAVGALTQELERMWGGKVPPPKKTSLIEELD